MQAPANANPKKSPVKRERVDTIREDHWRAVELRAEGLSLREIGRELGVSHQTARNYIMAGVEAIQTEQAKTMRTVEGTTLDKMQRALWPRVLEGDARAVAAMIRVMERRARLFGLDAPVVIEATVVDGSIDAEVARLSEQLQIERAPAQ